MYRFNLLSTYGRKSKRGWLRLKILLEQRDTTRKYACVSDEN